MAAHVENSNPAATDAEKAIQTQRNHEAIARLADDLLPALIAKLAASGLGEIEVREGGWKARLRMPIAPDEPRTGAAKAPESHPAKSHSGRAAAGHSRPEEHDRHPFPSDEAAEDTDRIVARSPAVGVYQPRRDLAVGMRVRAGDRIGTVNVLGVNQDVLSPVDGVIGSSLAEAGEAVEYGQDLVRIELPERAAETGAVRPEPEHARVAGDA